MTGGKMPDDHTCKHEGTLGRIDEKLESIDLKVDGVKSSQDRHFTKIYNVLEGYGDTPGIKTQTALNKTANEQNEKNVKRLWKWGGAVLGGYGIIMGAVIMVIVKMWGSQ